MFSWRFWATTGKIGKYEYRHRYWRGLFLLWFFPIFIQLYDQRVTDNINPYPRRQDTDTLVAITIVNIMEAEMSVTYYTKQDLDSYVAYEVERQTLAFKKTLMDID